MKFLILVQRKAYSPENSLVVQVLYKLALALGRYTSEVFSLESAKRVAMQCEAEGKNTTINSIFGEEKTSVNTFEPGTTVKLIDGNVDGVKDENP